MQHVQAQQRRDVCASMQCDVQTIATLARRTERLCFHTLDISAVVHCHGSVPVYAWLAACVVLFPSSGLE